MARCVNKFSNNAISPTWEMAVSTHQVGGTPFFMAPELFAGAEPSIKTDLFSFGVTLFSFLTRQHPYFDSTVNQRYTERFNHEPLVKFFEKRGEKLSCLNELISNCVSLDPEKRPKSYKGLEWSISQYGIEAKQYKQKMETGNKTANDLNAIIAKAMFFRETGNIAKAEEILREQIIKSPEDPITLNALGISHLKHGKRSDAIDVFTQAFAILTKTDGFLSGGLYLDPAINLACLFLDSKSYTLAMITLRAAWDWIEKGSQRLKSSPILDWWYYEFGWMFLYGGQFAEATEYLAKTTTRKALEKRSIYWLVESAWLGNCMPNHADFLVKSLIEFVNLDPAAAMCGCLAGQFSTPELSRKILSRLSPSCRKQISAAEVDAGFEADSLLHPKTIKSQKLIIRSLDALTTGGVHHGLVR